VIPNLEAFGGIYCMEESLTLWIFSDPSIAIFCPGKDKF
jgi:hypothetical protein